MEYIRVWADANIDYGKESEKNGFQNLIDFINKELIANQISFEFYGYGEVLIKASNRIEWILGISKIIERWQSRVTFDVIGGENDFIDVSHFDTNNKSIKKEKKIPDKTWYHSKKNKKENNGFKK